MRGFGCPNSIAALRSMPLIVRCIPLLCGANAPVRAFVGFIQLQVPDVQFVVTLILHYYSSIDEYEMQPKVDINFFHNFAEI
jgi:hypothetical protein